MLNLSIGTAVFAVLICVMPLIMKTFDLKYRKIIFLTVNTLLVILTAKDLKTAAISLIWIILPFFLAPAICSREVLKKTFYVLLIAVYAYLMGYGHMSPVRILGLSYFLFREIDFTMQYAYLKSDESPAEIKFVDYMNYVTSFYTLLAGPIERYEDFYIDFNRTQTDNADDTLPYIKRIIDGYFKVYVISSLLKYGSDIWFAKISETDTIPKAIIIFFIFATFNGWYIYFNFSGYCDVVIAAAALSGMHVHENFNRPYLARSVVEFWNRHHITLSEWIRDYIYSPVMKALISGPCRHALFAAQCAALFATFVIAGIWHGTNLNYLLYGLFQGLGIVSSTVYTSFLKKKLGRKGFRSYEAHIPVRIIENAVTWIYICLTFSFVGYDIIGMIRGLKL